MTDPETRTAGVVSRGAAGVLDVLVVLMVLACAYIGWVFARLAFSPRAFRFPEPSVVFSTIGFLGVATVYLAACWAISGRTVGAVVMGVEVVNRTAGRLRPLTAILRALACVVFPIGLGWVLLDPARRSAQDVVLGTRVVYRRT